MSWHDVLLPELTPWPRSLNPAIRRVTSGPLWSSLYTALKQGLLHDFDFFESGFLCPSCPIVVLQLTPLDIKFWNTRLWISRYHCDISEHKPNPLVPGQITRPVRPYLIDVSHDNSTDAILYFYAFIVDSYWIIWLNLLKSLHTLT